MRGRGLRPRPAVGGRRQATSTERGAHPSARAILAAWGSPAATAFGGENSPKGSESCTPTCPVSPRVLRAFASLLGNRHHDYHDIHLFFPHARVDWKSILFATHFVSASRCTASDTPHPRSQPSKWKCHESWKSLRNDSTAALHSSRSHVIT